MSLTRGIVFYKVAAHSDVARGIKSRIGVDSLKTTVARLVQLICDQQRIDSARHTATVRLDKPRAPILPLTAEVSNYAEVEVSFAKKDISAQAVASRALDEASDALLSAEGEARASHRKAKKTAGATLALDRMATVACKALPVARSVVESAKDGGTCPLCDSSDVVDPSDEPLCSTGCAVVCCLPCLTYIASVSTVGHGLCPVCGAPFTSSGQPRTSQDAGPQPSGRKSGEVHRTTVHLFAGPVPPQTQIDDSDTEDPLVAAALGVARRRRDESDDDCVEVAMPPAKAQRTEV